mmetsp:Transcript_39220/g.117159  ORF Transcript_39220/g.117159 Transcript_39220/m.117159 type:complete len:385 (-) Transcript_39220:76-1230(-)
MAARAGAGGPAKRAGTAVARPPAAKKPKAAPHTVEAMVESVATAVDKATSVSSTSREMLRRMSAGCLGTPADERHRYQAAVADMFQDVLALAEESVAEGIGEAAQEVDRAATKSSSVASTRRAKEAALVDSTEALETAKASFRKSNISLQSAKRALDEALSAQASKDGKARKAGVVKQAMEEALTEHFAKLTCEGVNLVPHVDALAIISKEAEIDEGLAKAFLVAARKDPGSRSFFDNAVVKQLESEYSKRIAELDDLLAAGSPGREERAAATATAEAALGEAKSRQRETAKELRTAELDRRDAESESWASKDAERAAANELRLAESCHAAAERELEDFRAGPLKSLALLLSRRAVVEAVVTEAGAAEAGREAAAPPAAAATAA